MALASRCSARYSFWCLGICFQRINHKSTYGFRGPAFDNWVSWYHGIRNMWISPFMGTTMYSLPLFSICILEPWHHISRITVLSLIFICIYLLFLYIFSFWMNEPQMFNSIYLQDESVEEFNIRPMRGSKVFFKHVHLFFVYSSHQLCYHIYIDSSMWISYNCLISRTSMVWGQL